MKHSDGTSRLPKALQDLTTSLQSANFDRGLEIVKVIDWKALGILGSSSQIEDILLAMKLRCMAAEVLDYYGRYDEAAQHLETHGAACFGELTALVRVGASQDDQRLLKQRVWILIHYGYVLYRRHQYDQAFSVWDKCRQVVSGDGTPPLLKDPSYWTRCRIHYSLGLAHRQKHEYDLANRAFTESIVCAWNNLERLFASPTVRSAPSRSYAALKALTDFTVAKNLALGISWVLYVQGTLHLARPLLVTARTLLAGTKDTIIKEYVNVIHACVQRSADADKATALQEAIDILTKSHAVFGDHNHMAYKVRAAHELALAYLQFASVAEGEVSTGHLNQAEIFVREVKAYSERQQDTRWLVNALIIESRIWRCRRDWGRAEAAANQALDIGQQWLFSRIDGHIARGEARLARGECSAASEDFEAALAQAGKNPKIRAVCHLHLADAALQHGDVRRAQRHKEEWQMVSDQVENAFIRVLGKRVEAAFGKAQRDFTVPWEASHLNPEGLQADLRRYMVSWARARTKSDLEAAALLKVSRQTFYNWAKPD